MGQIHQKYLSDVRVFGCLKCQTHLATLSGMLSRVRPTGVFIFHIQLVSPLGFLILRIASRPSPDNMDGRIYLIMCKFRA